MVPTFLSYSQNGGPYLVAKIWWQRLAPTKNGGTLFVANFTCTILFLAIFLMLNWYHTFSLVFYFKKWPKFWGDNVWHTSWPGYFLFKNAGKKLRKDGFWLICKNNALSSYNKTVQALAEANTNICALLLF